MILGLPDCYWDSQGFFVRIVPTWRSVAEQVAVDADRARHLVGSHREADSWHLHYRLEMEEDVLGSGGVPTGETKVSWSPKLKVQYAADTP